jgi:hypothetical protein
LKEAKLDPTVAEPSENTGGAWVMTVQS